MATVTAISTKGGGGGKGVLGYISRDDKTENGRWVTALNCTPATAYDEFRNTKQLYKKTVGIQYYHFVQSHPKGYEIRPDLAHKIAVEFAERGFKGFECVVATHTDADHIHSHIVFNSVSFEDGHKYHSNKFTLQELRELSDEICMKYDVATLDKPRLDCQTNGISTGEYRSAMKQQSWKMDLMNTIDLMMSKAKSRKHFLWLMRQEGYGVRWEEGRKYITYTCPNGMKCRDNKLHEEKYRKEMMEREFKIRGYEASLARERRESLGHQSGDVSVRQQLEGSDRLDQADLGYAGGDLGDAVGAADEGRDSVSASEDRGQFRAGADGAAEIAAGPGLTGWETERAILYADEAARRVQAQTQGQNVGCDNSLTGELGVAALGLGALVALIEDTPAEDDDDYPTTDRKRLAEEIRKKEELGMKM
ncbi:Relaxase/Mobilisation nuclease domain-containing protein [Ruminococcaceae bacterium FB2012]|nr:Relaxase/Mobilisation nuclease domain-containing protein [Ruminococcaceae bacterium FB2012]